MLLDVLGLEIEPVRLDRLSRPAAPLGTPAQQVDRRLRFDGAEGRLKGDGTLEGPNIDAYRDLLAAVGVPVFASGGVTTLDNIRELTRLGLTGCIVGRALYEGRLDLKQVIACARSV